MTNHGEIYKLAAKHYKQFRSWRRALHQYPELGFKEKKTAQLVATVCKQAGWTVKRQVAKTGVIAVIGKKNASPTMAIRADMDALPIQEKNNHSYKSMVPNVMHACGHDGNTSIALGAAHLLGKLQGRLKGQVKLIFQPCEETPPGGALAMIAAGALVSPKPSMVIAGHMDAQLPCGTIGLKAGTMMANVGAFTITIHGKGGHGAMPHHCIDPIIIAAQLITNLQQVVSRECDPLQPEVLSIGCISGGSAYNVIADQVQLLGTIRSLSKQERISMPKKIKRIAEGIGKAHRAKIEVEFENGHPALINDAHVTKRIKQASYKVLGDKAVREFTKPIMSGEDFTYYASQIPSCFFHVGAGFENTTMNYPWHHPKFDFNEQALISGTAVLVQTVLDYLT